jgi:hypothetical protein
MPHLRGTSPGPGPTPFSTLRFLCKVRRPFYNYVTFEVRIIFWRIVPAAHAWPNRWRAVDSGFAMAHAQGLTETSRESPMFASLATNIHKYLFAKLWGQCLFLACGPTLISLSQNQVRARASYISMAWKQCGALTSVYLHRH